jgi:hypothetical protein
MAEEQNINDIALLRKWNSKLNTLRQLKFKGDSEKTKAKKEKVKESAMKVLNEADATAETKDEARKVAHKASIQKAKEKAYEALREFNQEFKEDLHRFEEVRIWSEGYCWTNQNGETKSSFLFFLDTVSGVWTRTSRMQKLGSCIFEVIRSDPMADIPPVKPANPMMDIDVETKLNPNFRVAEVAPILEELTVEVVKDLYPDSTLRVGDQKALDSSNDKKQSMHVTYCSPTAPLFQTHKYGTGRIAAEMERRCLENHKKEEHLRDPRWEKLIITKYTKKKGNHMACCIDQAIYSNDRAMRPAYNNKAGDPNRKLLPLEQIPETADESEKDEKMKQVFINNLVVPEETHNRPILKDLDGRKFRAAKGSKSNQKKGRKNKKIISENNPRYKGIIEYCHKLMQEKNPQNQVYIHSVDLSNDGILYIGYSGAHYCPFENRAHGDGNGGNNTYHWVFLMDGTLVHRCHKCQGEETEPELLPADVLQDFADLEHKMLEENLEDDKDEDDDDDEGPVESIPLPDDIPVVQLTQQFVSNNDIDRSKSTILVRSYCETGKTELALKMMTENQGSILVVSEKTMLATQFGERFKSLELLDYRDPSLVDSQEIVMADRLIIQMESLGRILNRQKPFDFIYLDEITSLLYNFHGNTMKGIRGTVWRALQKLVNKAKQVLLTCADMDERTWNFVRTCGRDLSDSVMYYMPLSLNTDKNTYYRAGSFDVWLKELRQYLSQGKKIAIPINKGVKEAETLQKLILEASPDAKILVYHSEVSDQLKKGVAKCNEIWTNYDVVIYTPTINTGVDFSKEHFDVMMAEATNRSTVARSFYQQIRRVRKLRDRKVIYFVPHQKKPGNLPVDSKEIWVTTETKIDELLGQADRMLDFTIAGDNHWKIAKTDYSELFVVNLKEANASRNDFNEAFCCHLDGLGKRVTDFWGPELKKRLSKAAFKKKMQKDAEDRAETNRMMKELRKSTQKERCKRKAEVEVSVEEDSVIEKRIKRQEATEEDRFKMEQFTARKYYGFARQIQNSWKSIVP